MKYTCRVCKRKFTDLIEHLEEYKDEKHEMEWDNIFSNLHLGNQRCFCGGKIETISWDLSSEGDTTWETKCRKCGYLWDED